MTTTKVNKDKVNISQTIRTRSEAETEALGQNLSAKLKPGGVVALSGDLGAGKTCLIRGICRGLGISEPVLSPTFSLLNVYRTGRMHVHHMDVYRLRSPSEALDIGLEEILNSQGICVIEWAERIENLLPPETIWISLTHKGGDEREIRIGQALKGPATQS